MYIILLIIILDIVWSLNIARILNCIHMRNGNFFEIADELTKGTLHDGHLNRSEVEDLYESIHANMTSLIQEKQQIGNTTLNEKIFAYTLTAGTIVGHEKPSLLITSLFHAREVATIQMHMYLYLRLIYLYQQNDTKTVYLLQTARICMIPFVNQDGYDLVSKLFSYNIDRPLVRKNLNPKYCNEKKDDYLIGVDLNRNFPFHFDENNKNPCQTDYGGPEPFSEMETQALKSFIDNNPSIKIDINLHCFGNLWIIPYNYYEDEENKGLQRNSSAYKIYNEFETKANFSKNAKVGNAQKLIQYSAQGEASDWMLHDMNIITFSPELGAQLYFDDFDRNFFPNSTETFNLFGDEEQALMYIIQLITFQPHFINSTQILGDNQLFNLSKYLQVIHIQMQNKGLGSVPEDNQIITFKVMDDVDIKAVWVEIKGEELQTNYNKKSLTDLDLTKDTFVSYIPQIQGREYLSFYLVIDAPPHIYSVKLSTTMKRNDLEYYKHSQNILLQKSQILLRAHSEYNLKWLIAIGTILVLIGAIFLWRDQRMKIARRNLEQFHDKKDRIVQADEV